MRPGDRFDEYTLTRRLGEGGFGEVWEAEGPSGARVALKVPTHAEAIRALRKEGRIQERLSHPAIVPCLGVHLEHEPPYAVFALIEGRSLSEVLREQRTVPWQQAAQVMGTILDALEHAHASGIVHRDVKPGNILLGTDGKAYLTDFGLGRAIEAAAHSVSLSRSEADSARIEGTLRYMAPEQAAGREATPQTDLHAVGVVLHEMLTGDATRLRFPMSNTPRWFSTIVARATQPDPDRRFRSAGEMKLAIKREGRERGRRLDFFRGAVAGGWRSGMAARAVLVALFVLAYGLDYFVRRRPRYEAIPPPTVAPPWRPEESGPPPGPVLPLERTIRAREGPLSCIAVSSDGSFVAAGGYKNGLQVWEVSTGRETSRGPNNVAVTCLTFAHHAPFLFVGDASGEIRAWDVQADSERYRLEGHRGAVTGLAVREDDAEVVSCGKDSTMRLWSLASRSERGRLFDAQTLPGADGPAECFFALHGDTVLVRDAQGWVQEWDLEEMRRGITWRALAQGSGPIAFHPDGKRVACGGHVENVEVWDATTGKRVAEFMVARLSLSSLAFSPNGRYLAACGPEPCLWDLSIGQRIAVGGGDQVRALSVALTDALLFSACDDGLVRMWTLPSGK